MTSGENEQPPPATTSEVGTTIPAPASLSSSSSQPPVTQTSSSISPQIASKANGTSSTTTAAASPASTNGGGVNPLNRHLFFGNLHPALVSKSDLLRLCSPFGTVDDCRLTFHRGSTTSLGYGFVDFKRAEDADKARVALDGTMLHGRPITIQIAGDKNKGESRERERDRSRDRERSRDRSRDRSPFRERDRDDYDRHRRFRDSDRRDSRERDRFHAAPPPPPPPTELHSVYFSHLPHTITQASITQMLRAYPTPASIYIPVDPVSQEVKGIAFVKYSRREDAERVITEMNGQMIAGRDSPIQVRWAIDKNESRQQRAAANSNNNPSALSASNSNGPRNTSFVNLIVRPLPFGYNENALFSLFAPFGRVGEAHIRPDGSGIVSFPNEEDAARAMFKVHGMIIDASQRPLIVEKQIDPFPQRNGFPNTRNGPPMNGAPSNFNGPPQQQQRAPFNANNNVNNANAFAFPNQSNVVPPQSAAFNTAQSAPRSFAPNYAPQNSPPQYAYANGQQQQPSQPPSSMTAAPSQTSANPQAATTYANLTAALATLTSQIAQRVPATNQYAQQQTQSAAPSFQYQQPQPQPPAPVQPQYAPQSYSYPPTAPQYPAYQPPQLQQTPQQPQSVIPQLPPMPQPQYATQQYNVQPQQQQQQQQYQYRI